MVCMYLAFKKIGERNCFSPCLTIKVRIFNATIGTSPWEYAERDNF